MQHLDAATRHYWELVAQLGAALGWSQADVLSNLFSHSVVAEGYVYIRGQIESQAVQAGMDRD